MRIWAAIARILPPAFVLFLLVDLLMNPDIPRLGSVTVTMGKDGQLSEDASRTLLTHVRALVADGKDKEALEPALKLHAAWPENYIYIRTVAEIYQRQGRPKEESEYWEKFLQHAPLPGEGCPDIGQAYWKQNRRKEAVNAFERCLSFDPEDSDANFFLGHALERTGNLSRATELYRGVVKRHPKNMDCRIGLVRIMARLDRLAEAQDLILEVLADSPDNTDALLVAGIVYLRKGELERAKLYLVRGTKFITGYTDYYLLLGQIETSQGHRAEAAQMYARALEMDPDNDEARRHVPAAARKLP